MILYEVIITQWQTQTLNFWILFMGASANWIACTPCTFIWHCNILHSWSLRACACKCTGKGKQTQNLRAPSPAISSHSLSNDILPQTTRLNYFVSFTHLCVGSGWGWMQNWNIARQIRSWLLKYQCDVILFLPEMQRNVCAVPVFAIDWNKTKTVNLSSVRLVRAGAVMIRSRMPT